MRELDGREICGRRVRVEIARGGRRGGPGGGGLVCGLNRAV